MSARAGRTPVRGSSTLGARIKHLRRWLSPEPGRRISQQRFAELLGAAWSSVARWEAGHRPDRKTGAKIEAVQRVAEAIGDFLLPEGRLSFFDQRNPMLNNLRPIDVLGTPFGTEAVLDLVERAASGSFG